MRWGSRPNSFWRVFGDRPEDLRSWRVWFAKVLVVMGTVLFPIGSAVALPQYISQGYYLLVPVNVIACAVLLVRCFSKKEGYALDSFIIMSLLYVVTTFYFVVLGPDHARPGWLIVCAVIAALLFGVRGGIASIVLNALLMIVLYEVMGPGSVEWAGEYQASYYRWLNYVFNITLLAITSAVPTGYMLNQLGRSLKHAREAKKQLSDEGDRLKAVNAAKDREITLRRETEKKMREKEAYLRVLFEKAPDGYFLLGPEGRVVDINQSMEKILGCTKEDAIGRMFYETGSVPADEIPKAVAHFKRQIQGEDLVPTEGSVSRKDGSLVILEMNAFPIMIKGETHLLEIARDVTRRKHEEQEKRELKERLVQAQKMEAMGALAGGIAHDFNNLLQPILGYTTFLLDDFPKDSSQKACIEKVMNAGMRAKNLVQQILTFSRQAPREMIAVRLQKILEDVVSLCRSTVPSNIEIQCDFQKTCPAVMADPTQLHQVAMNLIINAYQAIDQAIGKISVRVKEVSPAETRVMSSRLKPGRYALLSVTDTGCGMDDDTMAKIFEPYFTTKEQGKGTGLGLAVAYGIIKEHNGDITISSKPGEGTSFDVYLPVTEAVTQNKEALNPAICQGGQERILIVDDEEIVVELLENIMKRLGYQVASFKSSPEALDAFKSDPEAFDLIITDMAMPEMTGDQLALKVLEISSQTPIILCTGFSERIGGEGAKAIGIKEFIMKPFSASEVAQKVRQVLSDRSV